jgi:hypothetical protein
MKNIATQLPKSFLFFCLILLSTGPSLVAQNSYNGYFWSFGPSAGYVFADRNNANLSYTWLGASNGAQLMNNSNVTLLSVANTGNVGIGLPGVPSSRYPLSLGGTLNNTKIGLWDEPNGTNSNFTYGLGIQPAQFRLHLGLPSARFSFLDAPAGREIFTIRGNGQVGINTGNIFPVGYMLAVKGSVIAEEVRINKFANWPDYVFQPTYILRPLAEVEQFIRTHGHLPNIPSAAQVQKEGGIDVGAMNARLLEKVEELTLYLIEEKKAREKLEAEVIALKNAKDQK